MNRPQQQLELAIHRPPTLPRPRRTSARAERARWWFNQMRAAVARAVDWNAPTETRSGQPWLLDPVPRLKV